MLSLLLLLLFRVLVVAAAVVLSLLLLPLSFIVLVDALLSLLSSVFSFQCLSC